MRRLEDDFTFWHRYKGSMMFGRVTLAAMPELRDDNQTTELLARFLSDIGPPNSRFRSDLD